MREIKGKAKITYPTKWKFKIICKKDCMAENTVKSILELQKFKIDFSNSSKKDRYSSYSIEMQILDENHLKNTYAALGDHPEILRVL
ncbi:MAG: DUF493 domain-containing protein [Candidatus Marinimicrobia bacterium]|nr:DUF493 domain-containing protein [Candidatus Neomarinimicrobiota bacterium]